MRLAIHLLLFILVVFSTLVSAQERGGAGANEAPYEFGFHVGNFLPNQIDGVTEIMGLGGARGGFRLSPGTYLETGIIAGNGEGVQWKNLHVDVRMNIPVEDLLAVAYVGADSVMYKGANGGEKLIFGGHVGGGVEAHLSGLVWFRADMKFGASPGTSLYIGCGLVFRLGASGSGS